MYLLMQAGENIEEWLAVLVFVHLWRLVLLL